MNLDEIEEAFQNAPIIVGEDIVQHLREFSIRIDESAFEWELPTYSDPQPELITIKEAEDSPKTIELRDEIFNRIKNLFIEHYGEDFVDVTKEDGDIYIVTHFPEILITNEVDEEHLIKDLYINMTFSIVEGNNKESILVGLTSITGTRTSLTTDEYWVNYVHSHLSAVPKTWGEFCYGNGEIKRIREKLDYSYWYVGREDDFIGHIHNLKDLEEYIDTLESFLFLQDEYLKWESINTNPYRYMSSIGTKSGESSYSSSYLSNNSSFIAAELVKGIFENKLLRDSFIDTCIVSTEEEFTINIYNTALFIDDLVNEDFRKTPQFRELSSFEYDPVTFITKGSAQGSPTLICDSDGVILDQNDYVSFKGHSIYRKLTDYKKPEEDVEDKLLIINPEIIAAVILHTVEMFNKIKYYDGNA